MNTTPKRLPPWLCVVIYILAELLICGIVLGGLALAWFLVYLALIGIGVLKP